MTDSGSSDNAAVAREQRGPDFVVPDAGATFAAASPGTGGTSPASGTAPPPGALPPLAPAPIIDSYAVPPSDGTSPPPQRSGPPKAVVVLAVVVAAVVIIGAGVRIMIMNRPPAAVQRPLPEDTARAFVEAGYRSDCPAVRATIDDDFWEGAGLTCLDVSFHGSDFADTTVADWAFTDTEITGDQASLTLDPPGEIPSTALHLRFVDGAWKITDWQF